MQKTRILLLRTDDPSTSWMRPSLEAAGHEVFEDGLHPGALEAARAGNPHVAVLTLSPRHAYAADLIQALRDLEPAIRVVIASPEGLQGLTERDLQDLDLEGVMRTDDGPLALAMWVRAAARAWRSRLRERRREEASRALVEIAAEARHASSAEEVLRAVLSRLHRLIGPEMRARVIGENELRPAEGTGHLVPLGDSLGHICVEHPQHAVVDRDLLGLVSALAGQALEVHRLRHRMAEDELTGALTRDAFHKQAVAAIQGMAREGGAFALAVFDVDRFKKVNDGHGHLTGDRVLREVAAVVRSTLRPGDFVGRFGGDEFMVGLQDTAGETAWQVLERLRQSVQDRVNVGSSAVTLSCGVVGLTSLTPVRLDANGASRILQQMLAEADRLLYVSKSRGRNTVTGDEDLSLLQLTREVTVLPATA